MSLFNARGELNASNLKEAMETITKFAAVMEQNVPSNVALSGHGLTEGQRDELISQAIMTHDGKIALAQAMANPIG